VIGTTSPSSTNDAGKPRSAPETAKHSREGVAVPGEKPD
jgi:hypothetical protein